MNNLDLSSLLGDFYDNLGYTEENRTKYPFESVHLNDNFPSSHNNESRVQGFESSPAAAVPTQHGTSPHTDGSAGVLVTPDTPGRLESPHHGIQPLYPNMACQFYNSDDLKSSPALETNISGYGNLGPQGSVIDIFDIGEYSPPSISSLLENFDGFDKSLADMVDDALSDGALKPAYACQQTDNASPSQTTSSWFENNGRVTPVPDTEVLEHTRLSPGLHAHNNCTSFSPQSRFQSNTRCTGVPELLSEPMQTYNTPSPHLDEDARALEQLPSSVQKNNNSATTRSRRNADASVRQKHNENERMRRKKLNDALEMLKKKNPSASSSKKVSKNCILSLTNARCFEFYQRSDKRKEERIQALQALPS